MTFGLYDKYKDQIKTGDLIEFKTPGIISTLIRIRTGKDVNHTAIALRLTNYDNERLFIGEATEDGFVPTILRHKLEKVDYTRAYWVPLRDEYEEYRHEIGKCLLTLIGRRPPYDYWALFTQLFGHTPLSPKKLFCSETVHCINKNIGIAQRDNAPWPGEFENTKLYGARQRIF